MTEAKLQTEIIKHLRKKGCFVIKHNGGVGVPAGTPDLSFYLEGFYGFIEVKKTAKSTFQPLQQKRLEQLNEWSWAKAVNVSNWPEVKAELEQIL